MTLFPITASGLRAGRCLGYQEVGKSGKWATDSSSRQTPHTRFLYIILYHAYTYLTYKKNLMEYIWFIANIKR